MFADVSRSSPISDFGFRISDCELRIGRRTVMN